MHTRVLTLTLLTLALLTALVGCSKANRAERHLKRADAFRQAADYEKARIEYLNVLRLSPDQPGAVQGLGLVLSAQGAPLSAAPYLLKAAQIAPENLQVRLRLGEFYLGAGQFDQARQQAIDVLDRDPESADAVLLLASAIGTNDVSTVRGRLDDLRRVGGDRAALRTASAALSLRDGDLSGAEVELQQALALDPQLAAAHAALASIHLARTNRDAAATAFQRAAELSPLRSSRRLRYIDFLIDGGAVAEGKALLVELIEQAPDYVPALAYRAQLEFGERDYRASATTLEAMLAREPMHYEGNVLRARLFLLDKEPARAAALLEALTGPYGKSAELRYQLALAQLLNQELPRAIGNLELAVNLNPNAPEPILLLAQINLGRGNFKEAVESLTTLIGQQPNMPRAYLELGRAQVGLGKPDDALAVYHEYTRRFPEDPQGPLQAGLVLRQQQQLSEARAQFESCLAIQTNYLPAAVQLVELDLLATNYPSAETRAAALARSLTNSAPAHLLLARVQLARGNHERAEIELKRTVELAPDDSAAYVLLTRLYVSTGRQQEALRQMETLLEKNPRDLGALMMIAGIHTEAGDLPAARDTYEKALALQPDFVLALNNLAYLYAEHFDQPDKAHELARKANGLRPDDPAIADTLGWVLYRKGQYPESLRHIDAAATKLPGNLEIQYHLGMAHYMMGNEPAARAALRQAVAATADFNGKDQATRALAILDLDISRFTPDLIAVLEQNVASNASDLISLNRLAAAYESQGRFVDAIRLREQALKANPDAVSTMVQLARLLANRDDTRQRALELARKARDLAPNDPDVLHTLGRLIFQAGDHPWAFSLLQESSRLEPRNAETLFDLAWAAWANGRLPDARDAAGRALAVSPGFDRATEAQRFVELIDLADDPSRLPQNRARIDEVLAVNPRFGPAQYAAARELEETGEVAGAASAYEALLAGYPEFAPAMLQLAGILVEDPSQLQRADSLARKARETLPQDSQLSLTLGRIAYERKDYTLAVSLLTDLTRSTRTNALGLYYLGMSYYQLEQHPEATRFLNLAAMQLDSDPRAEEAQRTLKIIKETDQSDSR